MFEEFLFLPGVLIGLLLTWLIIKFTPNPEKKTELFAVQPSGIWQEPHQDDYFPEEAICTHKKSSVDDLVLLMIKELESLGSRF